jgi:hypothetical protein
MSARTQNILLLLLSAVLTYLVHGEMVHWMDGKQVVAFEMLRTEAATNALLGSADWQHPDALSMTKADKLRQNTYWDFLYILGYTLTLFFFARTLLGSSHKRLKNMALLLLVAGVSDAVENVLMLQILDGSRGFFPAAMYGFAWLKFGALGVFLGWLAVAVVRRKMI